MNTETNARSRIHSRVGIASGAFVLAVALFGCSAGEASVPANESAGSNTAASNVEPAPFTPEFEARWEERSAEGFEELKEIYPSLMTLGLTMEGYEDVDVQDRVADSVLIGTSDSEAPANAEEIESFIVDEITNEPVNFVWEFETAPVVEN